MTYSNAPDHKLNEERFKKEQKKANKAFLVIVALVCAFPIALIAGLSWAIDQKEKPEYQSLEAAIRSVGTKILEKDNCDQGVQGYYKYHREDYNVLADEVVVCTNNFNKSWDRYPRLLKHEMTHIMQACLGTTINSPDEIRGLRAELKEDNESSYRTIHGAYEEKDHFHEVEARWMESQDFVYVNRQLQKHCASEPAHSERTASNQ